MHTKIPATASRSRRSIMLSASAMSIMLSGCASPMLYSEKYPDPKIDASGKVAAPLVRGIPYYLPKTMLPVDVKGGFVDKDGNAVDAGTSAVSYQIALKPGTPEQVADGNAPALLTYDLEAGTDDHFTLGVNAKGLLTTANLESEDKTGTILTSVADLVGRVAGPPGMTMMAMRLPHAAPKTKTCKDALRRFEYSGELDLSAGDPAADANREIMTAIHKPDFHAAGPVPLAIALSPEPASAGAAAAPDGSTVADTRGVLVRVAFPRTVTVVLDPSNLRFMDGAGKEVCRLEQGRSVTTLPPVMVADANRLVSIDTSRAVLVDKKVNLTIADGILTGVEVNKPSQLAALFAIPANLIDTYTKALFGTLTNRTTLTQDQLALLQAQTALITQQQALQAAQAQKKTN